jgi:hypothetical protein
MSSKKILGSLILGLAIFSVAAISTFAAGSRTFNILSPVSLNGTPIAAGEYKVSWQTHSPDATVTFAKGHKAITTAPGRLVESNTKFDRDMVISRIQPDGTRVLLELRLGGTNQSIVFDK